MKFALFLIIPILAFAACENRFEDSPGRWKVNGPVKQVTPPPRPGNPYVAPKNVVSVRKLDNAP